VPTATLDTNVYVSALVYRGTPMRLLHLAMEGNLDVAVSQPILDETARVLREKFGWSPERVEEATTLILRFARLVAPAHTLDVVKHDADDNRIVECAVTAGSEYIVTGDKDLHRPAKHGSVRVIKIADMLDILQGKA
jgi:uncharacterized protein